MQRLLSMKSYYAAKEITKMKAHKSLKTIYIMHLT
jgi:hypothetical protein